MYRIRDRGFRKGDQTALWALPDRVFFACGACHILAAAFLDRFAVEEAHPLWMKPGKGFHHNHIVVATEHWVFDYHGYAQRDAYLAHTIGKSQRWWPGFEATLVKLSREVLTSEARSRDVDGLWLREPGQFLHDAMPRAQTFLKRFESPPESCVFSNG